MRQFAIILITLSFLYGFISCFNHPSSSSKQDTGFVNGGYGKMYFKIKINGKIFDSILLNYYQQPGIIHKQNSGQYTFVCHEFSGVGYNFIGLIDSIKLKWIFKFSDTLGVWDNPRYLISPSHKYHAIAESTDGCCMTFSIFDNNGERKGHFTTYLTSEEQSGWRGANRFEYWDHARDYKNDTIELKKDYAWLRKCVWTPEKEFKTDSIVQSFEE